MKNDHQCSECKNIDDVHRRHEYIGHGWLIQAMLARTALHLNIPNKELRRHALQSCTDLTASRDQIFEYFHNDPL